jgi:dsDNA-binding SOS-regulon protein
MHDQYLMEITRQTHRAHEQKHRELRKRQKRAIDVMLDTTDFLLGWPDEQPLSKHDLWQQVTEVTLRNSRHDLREFQRLEERGYGDLLLNRYPQSPQIFCTLL